MELRIFVFGILFVFFVHATYELGFEARANFVDFEEKCLLKPMGEGFWGRISHGDITDIIPPHPVPQR